MSNILILVNTSQRDFLTTRTETIEATWAKDVIDHRYPNIRLWHCAPMSDETREQTPHKQIGIMDAPTNTCTVPYKDDLLFQFKKIMCALDTMPWDTSWADWLFITNTSAYVNVPLLNDFTQTLSVDDYKIYSSRVISAKYMSGPYQWCFCPYGDGILFRKDAWLPVLHSALVKKHFLQTDTYQEPAEFRRYKQMIFDTGMACLINDYLLDDQFFDCLKIYGVIEYTLGDEPHDHTKFYQDWEGIHATDIPEEDWFRYITMSVRCDSYEDTTRLMEIVNETVTQQYEDNDNKTDMRLISEYINSPKTPMVTQVDDKPDCCIDDAVRIPFDDYHKWLEENTTIPNLEIDENGDIVESDGSENHNGKRVNPYTGCPAGMTYAEYFNIPFWNRCCWYKNPYTPLCGYGPVAACCEAEQLVYP